MQVWEFGDTFILILRGKPVDFLHIYHHSMTELLTWSFPNLKPQTANHKPQPTNHNPQTTTHKPQTPNHKPQTLNPKPQGSTPRRLCRRLGAHRCQPCCSRPHVRTRCVAKVARGGGVGVCDVWLLGVWLREDRACACDNKNNKNKNVLRAGQVPLLCYHAAQWPSLVAAVADHHANIAGWTQNNFNFNFQVLNPKQL